MRIPSSGWLRRAAVLVPAGTAAALGIWYFATGSTYVPQGVLRIGFENVPPVQIRTANGPAGMAVETVSEAAKRAGLRLQWIETGTSSEEALRRRLVDLWPLMVDLPDRRKILHLTEPWLYTSHVVLLRSDALSQDKRFSGRIAVFKIPIHLRLVREAFPKALTQILCRRGFETLDVGNGADAINLLRAQSIKIDMMLLDMTIPGPSSREVAAVAAEARPEMKLVLTSAYDEKLVRSTVGAAQACGFVRKPFQIEELVHTLGSPFSVCVKNGLTGTSKDSRWASLNKCSG